MKSVLGYGLGAFERLKFHSVKTFLRSYQGDLKTLVWALLRHGWQ